MYKLTFFIGFLTMSLLLVGGMSYITILSLTTFLPILSTASKSLIGIFVFFPAVLVITMTIGNFYYNRVNALIYSVFVMWVPVLMYLFMGSIVLAVVNLEIPGVQDMMILTYSMLGIVAVLLIAGVRSALGPKIVTYTLKSTLLKEKWGDKKIVMFSDSHVGMVRREKFMSKVVGMINSLTPDIVFIAGDLIDGPVFPYDKGLSPLKDIKSTYGLFYAAGNHDEYNRQQEKYYEALNKYATVLNDKKIMVNDTQIVGVMFAQETLEATTTRLLGTGFDAKVPSIAMLHDPKNVKALADAGVSLTLSGHTHGGQFFPFTIAVWSVYKSLSKGVNYLGNMVQFTSVGVGTAGPIYRLGTQPEVVVIKIV
jgi:predicted MPP superfamily phosphohydrolase